MGLRWHPIKMLVELVAAEAVDCWRRLGPGALPLHFSPCGAAIEIADRAWLRGQVYAGLEEALPGQEATGLSERRERPKAGGEYPLSLRTWPASHGCDLVLARGNRQVRRWHFRTQPHSGPMPRRQWGRCALPATRSRPHLRSAAPGAFCLIGEDPVLAEWCRAAVAAMGGSGLWQTASPRLGLRWLLAQPRCHALLMDGNDGLWGFCPGHNQTAHCYPRPQGMREVVDVVRKMFHRQVESTEVPPGAAGGGQAKSLRCNPLSLAPGMQ